LVLARRLQGIMSIGPLQIVQMRKCAARSTWSLGDAAAEN
jgi:hypothetical protein